MSNSETSRSKNFKANSSGSKSPPVQPRQPTAKSPGRQRANPRAKILDPALVAQYGPIVPMPTSPDEYKKFEAAILGVVPGRQYGEDQTPVHRRVQLQIWAQHDAHRRKCNTMFLFWKVCTDGACRRAKSCAGQPHACFARWWPHVSPEFKVWMRAFVKARCAGASAEEADRAGRDAVARAHELDERFSQFDVMMKGESIATKPASTDNVARREPPLPRARFV